MNKERLQELYNRKLDNCLSGDDEREFEAYLQEHPEFLTEMDAYETVRTSLQDVVQAEQEPPYPDFFNSRLERMIMESEKSTSAVEAQPQKSWFSSIGSWSVSYTHLTLPTIYSV